MGPTPYRKPIKSSVIKSGKRTFFLDLNVSASNRKYVKVTESRVPEKEGEQAKRTSFVLFPEDVTQFQSVLGELVGLLN